MPQIQLYVDGACKGNPGPGGWGLVGFCDGVYGIHMFEHTEETTTNNREELKAMIEAFKLANECNLYEMLRRNNRIVLRIYQNNVHTSPHHQRHMSHQHKCVYHNNRNM